MIMDELVCIGNIVPAVEVAHPFWRIKILRKKAGVNYMIV